MSVTRGTISRSTRLLAVTGIMTTVLSCANPDGLAHRRHVPTATDRTVPATPTPWRSVPGVRVDCRTVRAHDFSETTLNDVAASGPDDVWAVGECASGGSDVHKLGMVEHWDGTKWRRVLTPRSSSYKSVVAYVYRFDWHPAGSPLSACHCVELPFTFGTLPAWRDAPMLAGAAPPGLVRTTQSAWISFARDGRPGDEWPVHRSPGDVLRLDHPTA